jgi:hypothetical protein
MILATCHTADNVRCLEFDATQWFREADVSSIIDLAHRGWASTTIADSLERRRGYEGLHELVEYVASDCNPTPSRIQLGKPSSVSSTGRRRWPGSRETGLMLRQESRARAGINRKQSRSCSGTEKVVGDRPPTETCRAQTVRAIGPRLPLGASNCRPKSRRSQFCIEWPRFGPERFERPP